MDILHAILLGIVEGVTEFLPISSTAHLTIVEKLMGYDLQAAGIVAFTAVIQIGAIIAAIIFFWKDIVSIVSQWFQGIFDRTRRGEPGYRMGWYIIVGTLPVLIVGLLLKHQVETVFRGLWIIAFGLILWSIVLFVADRYGKENRSESQVTWRDALFIGAMQCFALVPGVSRSGATTAGGLFRHIDRVTATRLSFFLGMPALIAAGAIEAATQVTHITESVGWLAVGVGIVTSFAVGYAAIAWLLRFVSHNTFTPFVVYRVALGVILIALLSTGILTN